MSKDDILQIFYLILSLQNSWRPQFLQCEPIQSVSNCSMAGCTSAGSLVRIPASKFRRKLLFMPMPAPVKFAEPM